MSKEKEVPLDVKAISIIRNHLDLAVSEITTLLKDEAIRLKAHVEVAPFEAKGIQHIDYNGKLYARVIQTENKLTILPVESYQIKADDPTITNFLRPRILEKIKEKHGFDYSIEESNGLLHAIIIRGSLDAKTIEELKSPVGWALEKASERDTTTTFTRASKVLKVIQHFPKDLADMLSFHDEGNWFKVVPKVFLGSENFSKVCSIIRELDGEYISAGKESHFKIPKKEMKQDG